eukprot:10478493-Heterocapsa_arctica.AAC.1
MGEMLFANVAIGGFGVWLKRAVEHGRFCVASESTTTSAKRSLAMINVFVDAGVQTQGHDWVVMELIASLNATAI